MNNVEHPINLQVIALETLLRYGFLIETPPVAQAQADKIAEPDFSRLPVKDLKVGDPVSVNLISTDPARGYIDFRVVSHQ